MSQYLPRYPESSPAQATNKQPDKLTDGQEVNVEELSFPAIDVHTIIGDVFKSSPKQLAKWQQTDPTLNKMSVVESKLKGRAKFLYQNGLLYRK